MVTKAMLQQENEVLRQQIAKLEKQLATCVSEKSEERFRSLFEQAPVAYQALDEQGCFVEVNPAYRKLTGYRDDELIGRSFGELWTPATRSGFAQAVETLKRENLIKADLQLVCRDGT
ncbi:MAG TPA: PAS domain S-box protein, partial [Anaerolineales bacterium]|nr:PAS domain S-box protein [Anaerolineales bacterium]